MQLWGKYKEIVESAVKSWPFGRHRITYQERFLFYAGDGGLVVMLGLASFTSISVYRGWLSTWWLYAAIILLIMWVFLAKLLLRLRLQWRLRKSDLSTLDSDN